MKSSVIRAAIPAMSIALCGAGEVTQTEDRVTAESNTSGTDEGIVAPVSAPREHAVTSDSRAFCSRLASAIDAHDSLPPEILILRQEGGKLCEEGRVRSGIARLRQALIVLKGQQVQ